MLRLLTCPRVQVCALENLSINAQVLGAFRQAASLRRPEKIKIQKNSLTKMHLKMLSAKWRPSCPGGDDLILWAFPQKIQWDQSHVLQIPSAHMAKHPMTDSVQYFLMQLSQAETCIQSLSIYRNTHSPPAGPCRAASFNLNLTHLVLILPLHNQFLIVNPALPQLLVNQN